MVLIQHQTKTLAFDVVLLAFYFSPVLPVKHCLKLDNIIKSRRFLM